MHICPFTQFSENSTYEDGRRRVDEIVWCNEWKFMEVHFKIR